MASDKRAKESQILPFGFNPEREIILHPAGIMFHIFNIIVIYRLLGLKFALSLAFFLLAIALFILLKPDEEA